MKYTTLSKIKKLYFGYGEIAKSFGISPGSARVSANRYVRQGAIIRIKRNLYVLAERWRTASNEEKFIIANLLQSPSYISLTTALQHYGITTQVQQDFTESIGLKRSRDFTSGSSVFRYTRISKKLYFGFSREKGVFIADPEKAFLDALYLKSLGRYSVDLSSIEMAKLNEKKLRQMSQRFPISIRRMLKTYGHA